MAGSIAWNTITESIGAHALTAVATDAAGNNGSMPTAVNVTVDNPHVLDIPIAAWTDDVEQKLTWRLDDVEQRPRHDDRWHDGAGRDRAPVHERPAP